MPKSAAPIVDDESLLTPDQVRRQRARIRARSSRHRRKLGEPLLPSGRLAHRSYVDAVFEFYEVDRLRRERGAITALRKALPKIVVGLRRVHDLPLAPSLPRLRVTPENAARVRRRYRLLALSPPGASADVWAEIVDHFGCMCAHCGKPASRAVPLPSGDPVPACPAHGTITAGSARNVQGSAA